jgi:hypothetical protein
MATRENWSREEHILAFNLYFTSARFTFETPRYKNLRRCSAGVLICFAKTCEFRSILSCSSAA